MEIESIEVTQIKLTKLKALDPIQVTLDDIEKGKGRIIITCYGSAWTSYWGGMSDRTISEFFCDCDEHYLANNLSSIKSTKMNMVSIGLRICRKKPTLNILIYAE
jgi:hypothetical protein